MNTSVKLTWSNIVSLEPNDDGLQKKYTVHFVLHGGSIFQWINTSREEVESEFKQIMDERIPMQILMEPQEAIAYTCQTDRFFTVWMNMGEQINDLVNTFLSRMTNES
jgi:hypothetical protein